MSDKQPLFELDYPFIGCGTALLVVVLLPLMWLAAVRFVPAPPAASGDYRAGAYAMCLSFASSAGAPPAQADSVCTELADDVAAERGD
jgi:hypothetical protein